MDFYIREVDLSVGNKQDLFYRVQTVSGQVSSTIYLVSDFDVRYLERIFALPSQYFLTPDAQATDHDYGSPQSSGFFLIDETTGADFGRIAGHDGDQNNTTFTSTDLGDAERSIIIKSDENGINGGVDYLIWGTWASVGYTDPTTNYTTFKTELCTQIKKSVEQYAPLNRAQDINVLIQRGITGQVTKVFYFVGNDPNYDDLVTI